MYDRYSYHNWGERSKPHTCGEKGNCIYIQDLKNIRYAKDVGMACQKVCKQGRDDIIVKVNLQSLIPTSFSHQSATLM